MNQLIDYMKKSGFVAKDSVWYKSPLKTFNIGIEDNVMVYWDATMDFSQQIVSHNPIKIIQTLITKEILES